MQSIMNAQHDFARVPKADIPRSTFNRSHGLKTTFDAGYLVPIFWDFALPGDTHMLDLTAFARLSTPIVPIMDNITMDFFFFSVPVRLVWENFKKLCGEQVDPGDSIAYVFPTIDVDGESEQSLTDYLALPLPSITCEVVSLWHRSYNLIYNEWFRDQNLQDSVVVDVDDGPDSISDYVLLRRGKRHDYFTSCLPWPQKGDAVEIPMSGEVPVTGLGKYTQTYGTSNVLVYQTDGNGTEQFTDSIAIDGASNDNKVYVENDPNNSGYPNVRADMTSAIMTVNDMRNAFQVQKLIERDARGGTRYTEKVRVHFGVISPDLRATRPQYLGGGSMPININPIAKTDFTAGTSGSDLSGYGTASGSAGFKASFTEHCCLLGLVSVRADLTYQQGIDRHFLMSTQYDMYWPVLAHVGEQAVEMQEIYFNEGNPTLNDDVWGYQERYAEYRYKPSKITGLFRSYATGTLEIWHLSEKFTTAPALNDSFIQCDPPIDRVIATPTEPHFIYDSYCKYTSVRPMPVYGVPGLIDHL